jgi:hypothetical protein
MRDDEARLETAIEELRSAQADGGQLAAAAGRVAGRLGLQYSALPAEALSITSCSDVKSLFGAYRAGTLSEAHSFLVQSHLRDCSLCERSYRSLTGTAPLDWSAPAAISPERKSAPKWRITPLVFAGALAPAAVVLACTVFLYQAYWRVPPGVRAEVESIDGPAYGISGAGDHALTAGDKLQEGDRLRTSGGGHVVLRLADGSTVEVNERSVVGVGAKGRSMTLSLDNGAMIVQAAKRTSGHLYVKTPDCRVAVTGTVFSVDSGIKGSRVAVLQGAVEVAHAGIDSRVEAGDQISTSENLSTEPIETEIAWSHNQKEYLGLLAQLALMQHRIGQIPFPEPRYHSDLLDRMPAGTLLYVSIPNLGNFLSEANSIFQEQVKQSPELQRWWNQSHKSDTAQLDALVAKLQEISQYLGDEAVIAGVEAGNQAGVQAGDSGKPGFAVVADLQKSGLEEVLKHTSFAGSNGHITVLDENALNAASASTTDQAALYALVRQHEVVFSNSTQTLKQMNAQLNAGASGFADGDFGKQIGAAYQRGAGVIFAADLQSMLSNQGDLLRAKHRSGNAVMEKSGLEEVRYVIAEHREKNGQPENHLNLQFSGTRQHVASWLAGPAPIGSLEFVTPNAAIAVAVLSKDPKSIADDLISMAGARDETSGDAEASLFHEAEEKMQINFRDDLAANLGGDFLVSLDGPVLPTPSWKAVIEVHDSQKLEQTLEQLARWSQTVQEGSAGKASHAIAIDSSEVSGQRYYAVRDTSAGTVIAHYTFADGFMIVAPSRALLIEALRTHSSGNSLARSAAFKALLPKDENENYSAIAYQNLSPVLTPLLSQVSGESANAIRNLAADARPTAICAWGEDTRIEAASDSHLFGLDFLTLGSLLHPGNKLSSLHVRD